MNIYDESTLNFWIWCAHGLHTQF